MASVKKTLRIPKELADRITEQRQDGETEAAAYVRTLQQGLEAFTQEPVGEETPSDLEAGADQDAGAEEIISLLKAQAEYLRSQLEAKDEQIKAKDEQIAEALKQSHILTSQAQAVAMAQASKKKRRGFMALLRGDTAEQ